MATRRLAILSSHLRQTSSSPISMLFCTSCDQLSKETSHENDCVFCKIIRGESPAFKLYEDDVCLCILDTYPVSRGHSLIIPKSHFSSLKATPPSVIAAICSKVPCISNAIVKATGSESFNLLVNDGATAGQVIFHTHIHIIPRKARDCLWDFKVRTGRWIPMHFFFLSDWRVDLELEGYRNSNILKFFQSLQRSHLQLDLETSQLADQVREQLSHTASEDSKVRES